MPGTKRKAPATAAEAPPIKKKFKVSKVRSEFATKYASKPTWNNTQKESAANKIGHFILKMRYKIPTYRKDSQYGKEGENTQSMYVVANWNPKDNAEATQKMTACMLDGQKKLDKWGHDMGEDRGTWLPCVNVKQANMYLTQGKTLTNTPVGAGVPEEFSDDGFNVRTLEKYEEVSLVPMTNERYAYVGASGYLIKTKMRNAAMTASDATEEDIKATFLSMENALPGIKAFVFNTKNLPLETVKKIAIDWGFKPTVYDEVEDSEAEAEDAD